MITDFSGLDDIETDLRAIIPMPNGGNLIMSGLPGLVIGRDGTSYILPEHCDQTFTKLQNLRTRAIYMLMEDIELPPLTKDIIQKAAVARNIDLHWMPIVDFNRPEEAFVTQWRGSIDYRTGITSVGDSICLSCMYGAGRSGMMATSIVAQSGKDSSDAIDYVRSFYPDAIGSEKQENWIKGNSYLNQ